MRAGVIVTIYLLHFVYSQGKITLELMLYSIKIEIFKAKLLSDTKFFNSLMNAAEENPREISPGLIFLLELIR